MAAFLAHRAVTPGTPFSRLDPGPALTSRPTDDYIQAMNFFLFQSEKNDRDYGFSVDETGANLPLGLGPWCVPDGASLPWNIRLAGDGCLASVLTALTQDGYYLMQADDPNIIRPTFGRRWYRNASLIPGLVEVEIDKDLEHFAGRPVGE